MISIWIVASRLKTCFFSCHSDLDPWLPHIWLVELKLKFAKMPKYEEIPSNLWSDCAFTRKEQTELHTDESEDMSRATLLVPVHKETSVERWSPLVLLQLMNIKAHETMTTHTVRYITGRAFFGVDAGLHIPLLCHLCLKAAVPSVRSQGEQLAVWLCNWKMNIAHCFFFFAIQGLFVGFRELISD